MTPKEKALRLVSKYRSSIKFSEEYGNPFDVEERVMTKQFALIAVDEILWLLNEIDYDLHSDNAIVFYNEVKQEIEKL
jgi:hypothetical protein